MKIFFLRLKPVKNKISGSIDNIEFHTIFKPFKPIKTIIPLYIFRLNVGRWKHRILLEAKGPEINDQI